MHRVQVIGNDVQTPAHADKQAAENAYHAQDLRNACAAAEVALRCHGPVADLPVAVHRDPDGRARSMPYGQIERLQQIRTVWLAARWVRAGWNLSDVEPLLHHGPGPEEAIPLIAAGTPVARLARWAGHDLTQSARWVKCPEVGAALAEALSREGLSPADVARLTSSGASAADLPGWIALAKSGQVSADDVPAWATSGVPSAMYQKINRPDRARTVSPERCREWLHSEIPAEHIRVYEYAGVTPTDIAPYGAVFAEHDPWDIVTAMGRLTGADAEIPPRVIVRYLRQGLPPYTAEFLDDHKFAVNAATRQQAVEHPWACFDRKQPPQIHWPDAEKILRTGRSSGSLFTLPSLLEGPLVDLIGAHHNGERIYRLTKNRSRRTGGRPAQPQRNVGVLCPAPYDALYDCEDLIGVVTRTGHIGCLPGYRYLRPFIDALTREGMHFVVPVTVEAESDYEVEAAVGFLPYRDLRPLIEQHGPADILWEWPPFRPLDFVPDGAEVISAK